MGEYPFAYEKFQGTTWAYLSSLLMIALFFKFNRFWSFRNLDLLLIVLLVPGLLMCEGGRQLQESRTAEAESAVASPSDELASQSGSDDGTQEQKEPPAQGSSEETTVPQEAEDPPVANDAVPVVSRSSQSTKSEAELVGDRWQRAGYVWLFSVSLLILTRLIIDPSLTRRPLLDPNLNKGGLFFFGGIMMLILTANVILSDVGSSSIDHGKNAMKMIQREAADEQDVASLRSRGPGYPLFFMIPVLSTFENGDEVLEADINEEDDTRFVVAAKIMAITSQVLIVLGLILFCYYNYDNLAVGVGTASIYLMLPYTAIYTGHVTHTLPAALMLWAFVCFRRPWLAGVLIGLATGAAYYPIFLLPLWASFYWERGSRRFVAGLLVALTVCVAGLIFTSVDSQDFVVQLQQMFGFWRPRMEGLQGIWALGWNSWWRLPILVAFVAYAVSFAAWPTEKNIGTLVAYTASILVAVQFWHGGGDGIGGGLYMAWYMPLLLLVVFRPNLNGRVAITELREIVKVKPESPEDLLPAA